MALAFIPTAKHTLLEEDIQAVSDSLREERITEGPVVETFEKAMADYCGVNYTVAFSSGTAAKMAAYFAAELSSFDWIICSPNTLVATIGAIVQKECRLHLIDIDRQTGNLDLHQLKDKLKLKSTRGRPFIVVNHFGGLTVDMQAVERMICHEDTIVIEDASLGLGSRYPDGKKVGCCACSQMTTFSFHPDRLITTGEGGMVATNDRNLYERLKLFRRNGVVRNGVLKQPPESWYYEFQAITGNFHMTGMQAALGCSQLKRIDQLVQKRKQLIHYYRERLGNLPHLTLFTDAFDDSIAFQLFVVQIDFAALQKSRQAVMQAMKEKGIGTDVHYIPLYYQPVFKYNLQMEQDLPEMELYYAQTLSLPLYHDLKEEDIDRICRTLKSVLGIGSHAIAK